MFYYTNTFIKDVHLSKLAVKTVHLLLYFKF